MIFHDSVPEFSAICFVCDHEIRNDEKVIDWDGGNEKGEFTAITLHVQCAHFMADGLMRDVLEARLGESTANAWYAEHRHSPRQSKVPGSH
jgi:hypothetical protein